MTHDEDRIAGVLEHAFTRHADHAPGADGLLERVDTLARRQRRRRAVAAVTVTALAALAIPLSVIWLNGNTDRQAVASDPAWRWESYGGIEVSVPTAWRHGTTGSPPCQANSKPYVGRPGPILAIGCGNPEGGWMQIPPLQSRASYLWFDSTRKPEVTTHDGGWVEETREIAGVAVTVLTDDDALRARIFDSAHVVTDRDSHGCTVSHPLVDDADWRPAPGSGGLTMLDQADSVSICRYTIVRPSRNSEPGHTQMDREPILSSARLTGDDAQRLVDDMVAAPDGTGPNEPALCSWQGPREETVILEVTSSARAQQVHFIYSTCDGIGTDDGATLRRLTPDLARTVLGGQNRPTVLTAPVVHWLYPRSGK